MDRADTYPGSAAIFRQHLDHIERGDMVQATADYAEDAVLEADPTGEQGLLLLGTFHGREAAGGWVEN
jgi:ketosteroid isomerase-like protein